MKLKFFKKKIICPYCRTLIDKMKTEDGNQNEHGTVSVCKCPNNKCNRELPCNLEKNSVFIGLVGFTGHGKTLYMLSLMYLLKNAIGVWAKDDEALNELFEEVNKLKNGELPQATNTISKNLYEITINEKGRLFTLFDVKGEDCSSKDNIVDKARALLYCDVIFLIADVFDTGNFDEFLKQLNILKNAKDQKYDPPLPKQHLIVVFTKGDMAKGKLPGNLWNYLLEGSIEKYNTANALSGVIKNLEKNSRNIEKWVKKQKCYNLKKEFKSVSYTIVSSIGAEPLGNGELGFKLSKNDPKRVLDPFLLAMKKMGFI